MVRLLLLCVACAGSVHAAKRRPLELQQVRLELPGPPSTVIGTDLDRDGIGDLVVVVAYTELENIGVDRIENMVQMTTVIPSLFDRREARAYLGRSDGTYTALAEPLPLPRSVLSVAAGAGEMPLLALVDSGLATIRLDADSRLVLDPLIEDPPVIAGSGVYFSGLKWVEDLDGDGDDDVLLPSATGLAIYLHGPDGLAREPAQRLTLPGDERVAATRVYPLPDVADVTGDGRPDLIVRNAQEVHVLVGVGDGTFRPIYDGQESCPLAETLLRIDAPGGESRTRMEHLVHFDDLDGEGAAELVMQETIEPEKSGMRADMKAAKKPQQAFRIHRLQQELTVAAEPFHEFEAVGHSFSGDLPTAFFHQFQDLDGDGRKDLVTVTLDFSIFGALKAVVTKRMQIGLDFHVWRQEEDGRFEEVRGLDLSEKLKLDLKKLGIGRLAQFAGDFDGDGRIDFVHFGRGKQITIHRGQPGCRYPEKPDLVVELEQEPEDLELVRVQDFDGDGRTDVSITHSLPVERQDESPPVILDLYLSGAGR